jgi:ribonuclease HI
VKHVEIFTDGACKGNPGPGGWGALLRMGHHEKELSGSEPATTNNRMELTGAIRALQALSEPCRVTFHTDSKYVLDGITRWVNGWQKNGWRTAAKKPVLNAELWRELIEAVRRTGSSGSGSRATTATPRTSASTPWPAPRRKRRVVRSGPARRARRRAARSFRRAAGRG